MRVSCLTFIGDQIRGENDDDEIVANSQLNLVHREFLPDIHTLDQDLVTPPGERLTTAKE